MNYKVENNINFFIELKKELEKGLSIESDISHNMTDNIVYNNICLITHQPLELNCVTLPCHHKFNYLPLYNDVLIQKRRYHEKKTFNCLETTHLALYQIMCPYCRTITNKLLPYIEHTNVLPIRGVNSPVRYCMSLHNCKWIIRTGKNKNNQCCHNAHETKFGIYCHTHQKLCQQKQKNEIDKQSKLCNVIQIKWGEKHDQLNKKYNVSQLKEILRGNKVKVSGIKRILVDRLVMLDLD